MTFIKTAAASLAAFAVLVTPLSVQAGTLLVERPDDERHSRALHGLTRSLVANMVVGVTDGFVKDLEIVGVGYRATAQGPDAIELALGYSHPVRVAAPEGVTFEVPAPNRVRVAGIGGKPRPPTLKVSIGCTEGFIGELPREKDMWWVGLGFTIGTEF